jgi:isopentenyl diphosphate isomerase/L-lactate dehydrogenase-like FMN-dependent dehydrogenase
MRHFAESSRRDFLRWLAASPLLPWLAGCDGGGVGGLFAQESPRRTLEALPLTPQEALDVFDMERVARETLPPAHFGYIATGVDGEETQANNRSGYERMWLRARRLVDVSSVDMRTTIFGREWPTPIVVAPAGSQRGFHGDGELATARAARARTHLQALSTVSSTAVEEVNEARGEPVWYQLYATSNWDVTTAIVRRVREAGCPVLILTVDLPVTSNRLTQERWARTDDRECAGCHRPGGRADPMKPMFRGTPYSPSDFRTPSMTWDIVARLRDVTDQRIVVKGLVTAEDADLAVRYGVDAVWVSNHGGRSEGSGRATIDALPEVVDAVAGRAPVIVDGGVRRGTDVFKALARGATAVAIGRPYLWGLGAFGQAGVERVLEILTNELRTTMQLAGTPSRADIGAHSVGVG